ncbi:MAG: gliding motility-associated C-terminal domain-containing protein [bacterium]|nr:gliding motility-associated C-terminal domain-containing protein [bacterium]
MKLVTIQQAVIVLFTFGFSSLSQAQIQCDIDVEIIEGDSIEMCANAIAPLNATGGYVDYVWTGSTPGSTQQYFPTGSGQHIVFAEDAIGCISSDTIEVIVHPLPVDNIISSAGDTLCGGGTSTLSLGSSYSMYNWTGGVTTPSLQVSESGTYSVSVVDGNDCVATFTFDIGIVTGDIQIVSENSCLNTFALQASGGSQYSWSTGESSDVIVVSPEESTTYDVTIVEGSCVLNESITVAPTPSNTGNFSIPDTSYVEAGENLMILGPDGFSTYVWSPGEQLQDSTTSSVIFNGTETQTITLTATHPDGCVFEETFTVIVVDLTVPDGFSPNGDLINDTFVIPELDSLMGELVIWNRWGDIVFEAKDYQNDWNGTCLSNFCFPNGGALTDGTYFYHLNVGGVEKEGYITLLR